MLEHFFHYENVSEKLIRPATMNSFVYEYETHSLTIFRMPKTNFLQFSLHNL